MHVGVWLRWGGCRRIRFTFWTSQYYLMHAHMCQWPFNLHTESGLFLCALWIITETERTQGGQGERIGERKTVKNRKVNRRVERTGRERERLKRHCWDTKHNRTFLQRRKECKWEQQFRQTQRESGSKNRYWEKRRRRKSEGEVKTEGCHVKRGRGKNMSMRVREKREQAVQANDKNVFLPEFHHKFVLAGYWKQL